MTTTFVIAAVLVLMIFSDHITHVVVKGDPDTSFHFKCCGSTSDASGQARTNALAVMDAAIALVSPGKGFHACDYGPDGPLAGYARCYPSSSSDDDCKLCLYNAQFRVVDVECPGVTEGRLELENCAVAYSTARPCLADISELKMSRELQKKKVLQQRNPRELRIQLK